MRAPKRRCDRTDLGIATMREFYSAEGIDQNAHNILESLADAAEVTFNGEWNDDQRRNLIGVLLRTAFQVGKAKS